MRKNIRPACGCLSVPVTTISAAPPRGESQTKLENSRSECVIISPTIPENRCDLVTTGRFLPGKSGNPGGRPREVGHVKELARQHTPEAIQTLAAIMADPKEPSAARVRAAEALLDRAWGKPAQQISGELNINRDVRDMSTAELLAIVAADRENERDEQPESEPLH